MGSSKQKKPRRDQFGRYWWPAGSCLPEDGGRCSWREGVGAPAVPGVWPYMHVSAGSLGSCFLHWDKHAYMKRRGASRTMNDVRLQVRADHLKAAKQGCWRGRSQARAQPRESGRDRAGVVCTQETESLVPGPRRKEQAVSRKPEHQCQRPPRSC